MEMEMGLEELGWRWRWGWRIRRFWMYSVF